MTTTLMKCGEVDYVLRIVQERGREIHEIHLLPLFDTGQDEAALHLMPFIYISNFVGHDMKYWRVFAGSKLSYSSGGPTSRPLKSGY